MAVEQGTQGVVAVQGGGEDGGLRRQSIGLQIDFSSSFVFFVFFSLSFLHATRRMCDKRFLGMCVCVYERVRARHC